MDKRFLKSPEPARYSHRRKLSCKVLSYHRILPFEKVESAVTQRTLIVTPETFRKQLCFLRERYNIITLDDIAKAVSSGSGFDKPSCAITFDDGWRDNYFHAFPVLEELSVPATIFVATEHIETGEEFWPERLTKILLAMDHSKREAGATLERLFPSVVSYYEQNCREGLMRYANRVIISMKDNPQEKIHAVLSQLQKSESVRRALGENERYVCSWNELDEMASTGLMTVGSHTKSHTILTNETNGRCKEEILDSKKTIEAKLGRPAKHFSYPNGNFNRILEEMVKGAGYESASTCISGVNRHDTSPYLIRRIHVCDPYVTQGRAYSRFRFGLEISRYWHALKRVRTAFGNGMY